MEHGGRGAVRRHLRPDIFRGIDLNQMNTVGAMGGAFLQDFARARQNGYLSRRGGAFDPAYTGPGSQPLTVLRSSATGERDRPVRDPAERAGAPGGLLHHHRSDGGGQRRVLPNPGIYAAEFVTNGSFQNYNALQLELRRQFRQGIWGRSSTRGVKRGRMRSARRQSRIEPYLDNARPELDEGRSLFHTGHVINCECDRRAAVRNGKRWLNGGGLLDASWAAGRLAAIVKWQSGSPISHLLQPRLVQPRRTLRPPDGGDLAERGTDQEPVRRARAQTARCISSTRTSSTATGRAVGPDTLAGTGFNGQVFFNPGGGQVGSMES